MPSIAQQDYKIYGDTGYKNESEVEIIFTARGVMFPKDFLADYLKYKSQSPISRAAFMDSALVYTNDESASGLQLTKQISFGLLVNKVGYSGSLQRDLQMHSVENALSNYPEGVTPGFFNLIWEYSVEAARKYKDLYTFDSLSSSSTANNWGLLFEEQNEIYITDTETGKLVEGLVGDDHYPKAFRLSDEAVGSKDTVSLPIEKMREFFTGVLSCNTL